MKIILYGRHQIASDSEKTVLTWTKKEIITHSASYEAWRHDILKQLRRKYKLKIDKPITIEMCFYLNKKETKDRLFMCCNDIIRCLIDCQTFVSFAIVTPRITQKITEEFPRIEITI